ncbi:hypothetical protein KVF89_04185 [Nocardioides carbamazepini]|uniref:hypothetical protein n=1 Tax=Nocardioides carbamazepini TaxID=2854259 RepID=UPI00214A76ED|nr:hypothetical protein [Nocardioides carbamazepini]MCR1781725.1 hypothetical protein [Nocardioides carbamazepini]
MAESVKMQFEVLYRAGTKSFPDQAADLAAALDGIGAVHQQWYEPTVRAGSPPALAQALEINRTVYGLLRRAVLSFQDAASAVVLITKDFQARDAEARDAMHALGIKESDIQAPPMAAPPTFGQATS